MYFYIILIVFLFMSVKLLKLICLVNACICGDISLICGRGCGVRGNLAGKELSVEKIPWRHKSRVADPVGVDPHPSLQKNLIRIRFSMKNRVRIRIRPSKTTRIESGQNIKFKITPRIF